MFACIAPVDVAGCKERSTGQPSCPLLNSRSPVTSRRVRSAVRPVGGGVRLASEVRCEQVGVTDGDF